MGSLVSPAGIEPATHSLEGCCSIRLSYEDETGREIGRGDRIRTYDPLLPKQVRYQTALHPDANLTQQRLRRIRFLRRRDRLRLLGRDRCVSGESRLPTASPSAGRERTRR